MSGFNAGIPPLYTAPWQGFPTPPPADVGQKAFSATGQVGGQLTFPDGTTQGSLRELGELGSFPIGQLDVRTPLMQFLEAQLAPALSMILSNPQAVAQQFSSIAGPVPGVPQSQLAQSLFGGQASPFYQAPGVSAPPLPPAGGTGGGGALPPTGGTGDTGGTGGSTDGGTQIPSGSTGTQGNFSTNPNTAVPDGYGIIYGPGWHDGTPEGQAAFEQYMGLVSGSGPAFPDPNAVNAGQTFGYTGDFGGSHLLNTLNSLLGGSTATAPTASSPLQGIAPPVDETQGLPTEAGELTQSITGPNPVTVSNPTGAVDPNYTGTTLTGAQVPVEGFAPTPAVGGLTPELQSLLAIGGDTGANYALTSGLQDLFNVFGLDSGSAAFTGTTNPYGTGLNLTTLNEQLLPQGYLAGLTNDGNSQLGLYSTGGYYQPVQDQAALEQLLGDTGLDFRATGGLLDPENFTVVGEQGPELISPSIGGEQQVMPLNNNIFSTATSAPTNAFPTSPLQGEGTGMIGQLLQQNPEMQTFNQANQLLSDPQGILGSGGGGQAVVQALQPVFQQNLGFALNELTNRIPSVRNSAAAIQGADLGSRALNDFNLMAAQALQQGQQNTLGGLGLLGQLASSAGGGQFGRALQAGQLATQRDIGLGGLSLQAQQQAYDQAVNPTLQLLMAAFGLATPTAFQTVVPGQK